MIEESVKITSEEYKKRNFQKELDAVLEGLKAVTPDTGDKGLKTLFLHSCCAPCSSYVIAYLSDCFRITVFYYNPNISDVDEYKKRVIEQKRFIEEYPAKYPVTFIEGDYEPEKFFERTRGMENEPECGIRCKECYGLRLTKTAREAKERGFDYFATTLTLSPLKYAPLINQIGEKAGDLYGVKYLVSDFKKKNGYKRSTDLSDEYNLYRQNYCGCVFSKKQGI